MGNTGGKSEKSFEGRANTRKASREAMTLST